MLWASFSSWRHQNIFKLRATYNNKLNYQNFSFEQLDFGTLWGDVTSQIHFSHGLMPHRIHQLSRHMLHRVTFTHRSFSFANALLQVANPILKIRAPAGNVCQGCAGVFNLPRNDIEFCDLEVEVCDSDDMKFWRWRRHVFDGSIDVTQRWN